MRDDQPNIEDRATQPMEAGGWVSQQVLKKTEKKLEKDEKKF